MLATLLLFACVPFTANIPAVTSVLKNPASCVVIKSSVTDLIAAVGFPEVSAVCHSTVSAVSGVPAFVVVVSAVDAPGVSDVDAVPDAIDVLSATGISNVSVIPAVVRQCRCWRSYCG